LRRSLLALVYFSVSKINSIDYRNVLKNPSIRIDARGGEAKFQAAPISDDKAVKSVVEKFREKYGAKDVKKYYSKFDVAVVVQLT